MSRDAVGWNDRAITVGRSPNGDWKPAPKNIAEADIAERCSKAAIGARESAVESANVGYRAPRREQWTRITGGIEPSLNRFRQRGMDPKWCARQDLNLYDVTH